MSGHTTQIILPRQVSKMPIFDQLVAAMDIRKLDPVAIRKLCDDLGIPTMGQSDDSMLAIGHHARLQLINATPEEKSESETWLRFRGLM